MRTAVSLTVLSLLASSIAVFACSSSSSSSTATNDGGTSAGDDSGAASGDDAGADSGEVLGTQCGAAPYVTLGITVRQAGADGGGDLLPGVKFTSPLCPGLDQITDDAGRISGQVAKSTPFWGRFESSGYVNLMTPEQSYAADDDTVTIQMLPALFTSLVPGYDAAKATIFVGSFVSGGTGACGTVDGISMSVDGHPEAAPSYYTDTAIPQSVPSATTTTTGGRASFVGLAEGEPVTLTATKPGCKVTFVNGADTGRAPLQAGYITIIGAYVSNGDDGGASDASTD